MLSAKKVAIFGFGKEGVASVNYLGSKNKVTVFDEKPKSKIEKEFFENLKIKNVDFYFGGNLPKNVRFDYVVRSAGVKPDNKIIEALINKGATLTSATKIFFEDCPAEIIGVTGTKGKGTTSTLIQRLIKTPNKSVFLAGNIGTPALEILPKLKKDSLVVLELSSFQLIDLKASPHLAVVLMITQEHLDWHTSKSEYVESKKPIVAYQKNNDYAVINRDFASSFSFADKTKAKVFFFSLVKKTNGVYLLGDKIISNISSYEEICNIDKIVLPGRHNLQNVLAALTVAKIYRIQNKNIIKVLSTFRGLVHRLQYLGQAGGVHFYNDSFSTIPETTIAAIEAVVESKILILGGSSKNSNFGDLAKKIIEDRSIKAVVLIGYESRRIKEAIAKSGTFRGKLIEGAKNMQKIVAMAKKVSEPGDAVILSPACASFDMFKNYQDRGQQFIREVQKLGAK